MSPAVAAPEASLKCPAIKSDAVASRKREPGGLRVSDVWSVPMSGVFPGLRAVPLAAVIASHVPAVVAWGGSASGSGQARLINGGAGRHRDDLAPGRLVMKAAHAARADGWGMRGWALAWARQRICPSHRP